MVLKLAEGEIIKHQQSWDGGDLVWRETLHALELKRRQQQEHQRSANSLVATTEGGLERWFEWVQEEAAESHVGP